MSTTTLSIDALRRRLIDRRITSVESGCTNAEVVALGLDDGSRIEFAWRIGGAPSGGVGILVEPLPVGGERR